MKKLLLFLAFLMTSPVWGGDRYWRGGACVSKNWNDNDCWSAAALGTPPATPPAAGDNVYFDANSGVGAAANCNVNMTTPAVNVYAGAGSSWYDGTITVTNTPTTNRLVTTDLELYGNGSVVLTGTGTKLVVSQNIVIYNTTITGTGNFQITGSVAADLFAAPGRIQTPVQYAATGKTIRDRYNPLTNAIFATTGSFEMATATSLNLGASPDHPGEAELQVGRIFFTGSGNLNLGTRELQISGTDFTRTSVTATFTAPAGSTVRFTNTVPATINNNGVNWNVGNLIIAGTSSVTALNNITVSQNLTVQSGSLSIGTFSLTNSGVGAVTQVTGGTINLGSNNSHFFDSLNMSAGTINWGSGTGEIQVSQLNFTGGTTNVPDPNKLLRILVPGGGSSTIFGTSNAHRLPKVFFQNTTDNVFFNGSVYVAGDFIHDNGNGQASTYINGDLYINGNAVFGGNPPIPVQLNGRLYSRGSFQAYPLAAPPTFISNPGSRMIFDGGGNQNITSEILGYDVEFAGGGIKTLTVGPVTVPGSFRVNGVTVNAGAIPSLTVGTAAPGVFEVAGTLNVPPLTQITGNVILGNANAVNCAGCDVQLRESLNSAANNFTINANAAGDGFNPNVNLFVIATGQNQDTWEIMSGLQVNQIELDAAEFTTNGNSVTALRDLAIRPGSTLNAGSSLLTAGNDFLNSGGVFNAGTSTVRLNGAFLAGAPFTVNSVSPLYDLEVDLTNPAHVVQRVTNNLEVSRNLRINSGILDLGVAPGNTLTMSNPGSSLVIGDGIGAAGSAELRHSTATIVLDGNLIRNPVDGRYVPAMVATGVFTFDGASSVSGIGNTSTFTDNAILHLSVNGTLTVPPAETLTVTQQLWLNPGGTITGNGDIYISCAGPTFPQPLQFNGGGLAGPGGLTMRVTGGNTCDVSGAIARPLTVTGSGASNLRLTGTLTTTLPVLVAADANEIVTLDVEAQNLNVNDITIGLDATNRAGRLRLTSGLADVNGNLTVGNTSGNDSSVVMGSGEIQVAGNLTARDSWPMPAAGSLLQLDGTGAQTIAGIINTQVFSILPGPGARTITFQTTFPGETVITADDSWDASGLSAAARTTLVASNPANQWELTGAGTKTGNFIEVRDSIANGANTPVFPTNSVNLGNNTNWFTLLFFSRISGNFTTIGTWGNACGAGSNGSVPTATDQINICPGTIVTVDAPSTVATTNIQATGNLTLNQDFTSGDLTNSGTLNLNGRELILTGNLDSTGAILTTGSERVRFVGTNNDIANSYTVRTSGANLRHVIFDNAEDSGAALEDAWSLQDQLFANPGVAGPALTVIRGKVDLDTVQVDAVGDFTMSGGALTAAPTANTFVVGGGFNITGGVFPANRHVILNYNGPLVQPLRTSGNAIGRLSLRDSVVDGNIGTYELMDPLVTTTSGGLNGNLEIGLGVDNELHFSTNALSNQPMTIAGDIVGDTSTGDINLHDSTVTILGNWNLTYGSLNNGTSEVIFAGPGNATINGITNFYDITINKSAATDTVSPTADLFPHNQIWVRNGVLDASAGDIEVVTMPTGSIRIGDGVGAAGSATLIQGGYIEVSSVLNRNLTDGRFLPSAGYSLIIGTGTITGFNNTSFTENFLNDLRLSGSTTVAPGQVLAVRNGLSLFPTATLSTSADIQVQATANAIALLDLQAGSTLTGTGDIIASALPPVVNVGVSGRDFGSRDLSFISAGTTTTFTINTGDLTTTGDILVGAGTAGDSTILNTSGANFGISARNITLGSTGNGSLQANASTVNITGDLALNTGASNYLAGASTLRFSGSGNQTISALTLSTFNLAIPAPGTPAARTVTFADGANITVNNTFSAAGNDAGNLLTLQSVTPGTAWNLNISNVAGVLLAPEFVRVRDSNAAGSVISIPTGGIYTSANGNISGNSNWLFANATFYSLGGNWFNGTDWTIAGCGGGPPAGQIPNGNRDVEICPGSYILITSSLTADARSIRVHATSTLELEDNTTRLNLQGSLVQDLGGGLTGPDQRIHLQGTGSINTNGQSGPITLSLEATGTYTLASNFLSTNPATLTLGTLSLTNAGVPYSFGARGVTLNGATVNVGDGIFASGDYSAYAYGDTMDLISGTLNIGNAGQIRTIGNLSIGVPVAISQAAGAQWNFFGIANATAESFSLDSNGRTLNNVGIFAPDSSDTYLVNGPLSIAGDLGVQSGVLRAYDGATSQNITVGRDVTLPLASGTLNMEAGLLTVGRNFSGTGGVYASLTGQITRFSGSAAGSALISGDASFQRVEFLPSLTTANWAPAVLESLRINEQWTVQGNTAVSGSLRINATNTITSPLQITGTPVIGLTTLTIVNGKTDGSPQIRGYDYGAEIVIRNNGGTSPAVIDPASTLPLRANTIRIQDQFSVNGEALQAATDLFVERSTSPIEAELLDGGLDSSVTTRNLITSDVSVVNLTGASSVLTISGNVTDLRPGPSTYSAAIIRFSSNANQSVGQPNTGTMTFTGPVPAAARLEIINTNAAAPRTIDFVSGSLYRTTGTLLIQGVSATARMRITSNIATGAFTMEANAIDPASNFIEVLDSIATGPALTGVQTTFFGPSAVPIANFVNLGNTTDWFQITRLYARTSGMWSVPATWSEFTCSGPATTSVPDATLDVEVCGGYAITADTGASTANLDILNGSVTTTDILNVNGSLNIAATGALVASAAFPVQLSGTGTHNLTVTGAVTGGSVIRQTGTGSYTLAANAAYNGELRLVSTGSFQVPAARTLDVRVMHVDGATFNLSGSLTADTIQYISGTVNLNNSQTVLGGTYNCTPSCAYSVTGATVNNGTSRITYTGTGPLLAFAANVWDMTVDRAMSINSPVNVAGTLNLTTAATDLQVVGTTLTVQTFNRNNGIFELAAGSTLTVNGAFNNTGGLMTVPFGGVIMNGTALQSQLRLCRDASCTQVVPNDAGLDGFGLDGILPMYIEITDRNLNLNGTAADVYNFTSFAGNQVVINVNGAPQEADDTPASGYFFTETGPSTGVFRSGPIAFSDLLPVLGDGIVQGAVADVLSVIYNDPYNPADTRVSQTRLTASLSPVFAADIPLNSSKISDNYLDFREKRVTIIGFNLSKSAQVSVELLDMQGRRLKTVAETTLGVGKNGIDWDVSREDIPPGIYILMIRADYWNKPVMERIMVVR